MMICHYRRQRSLSIFYMQLVSLNQAINYSLVPSKDVKENNYLSIQDIVLLNFKNNMLENMGKFQAHDTRIT